MENILSVCVLLPSFSMYFTDTKHFDIFFRLWTFLVAPLLSSLIPCDIFVGLDEPLWFFLVLWLQDRVFITPKISEKHHFDRVRPFVHTQFEWDIDLGRPLRRRLAKGLLWQNVTLAVWLNLPSSLLQVIKWHHCIALCIFWRYNDPFIAQMRSRMQSRVSTFGDNCAFEKVV